MAQILDIDLETGDLSQFDSTTTDGGRLSWAAAAALTGTTGGLSCQIDSDMDPIYGTNTFTTFSSHSHRYRVYLRPNSLGMSSGDLITVVDLAQTGHDTQSYCQLYYNGSDYQVRARVRNDAGTWQNTSYYDIEDKEELLSYLGSFLSKNRKKRFEEVLENRTRHLTVAVEDVYKDRNASAIVRTADCFGIQEVHIIENYNEYKLSPGIAKGSDKWVNVSVYDREEHNTFSCLNKNLLFIGYPPFSLLLL